MDFCFDIIQSDYENLFLKDKSSDILYFVIVNKSHEKTKTNCNMDCLCSQNLIRLILLFRRAPLLSKTTLLHRVKMFLHFHDHGHCILFSLNPAYTALFL